MAVERKEQESRAILNKKEPLLIPRVLPLCFDLLVMMLMQVKESRHRLLPLREDTVS